MIKYDGGAWVKMLFMWSAKTGSVVGPVAPQCFLTMLISFGAMWMAHQGQEGPLTDVNTKTLPNGYLLEFSTQGHLLLQIAMGFLLVFRSNLSYQRYWEGRGHLGVLVKCMRDLSRQCTIYMDSSDAAGQERLFKITGYLKIWFHINTLHLRDEKPGSEISTLQFEQACEKLKWVKDGFITEKESLLLGRESRRPLVVVAWISRELRQARDADFVERWEYLEMEANMSKIITAFNGCDKISSTPIPFPYAQILVYLLCIYNFSIPFALVSKFQALTPIPCAVLSMALFGINEVGLQIEDPFGEDPNDLPLDGMAKAIEEDVNCFLTINTIEEVEQDGRASIDSEECRRSQHAGRSHFQKQLLAHQKSQRQRHGFSAAPGRSTGY